jgi:hypothetical protein
MTAALYRSLDRLETYTARARRSVERADYAQAMADIAEASEISLRLWKELAKANLERTHD